MLLWLLNLDFAGSDAEAQVWAPYSEPSTTWTASPENDGTWTPYTENSTTWS